MLLYHWKLPFYAPYSLPPKNVSGIFLEICDIYIVVQQILLEYSLDLDSVFFSLRGLGFPSSKFYTFSAHYSLVVCVLAIDNEIIVLILIFQIFLEYEKD